MPTKPTDDDGETTGVRSGLLNDARHDHADKRLGHIGHRLTHTEKRVDTVETEVARIGAGHTETVRQLARGMTPLTRAHHEISHRAADTAREALKSVSDEVVRHDDTTLAIGRYLAVAVGGLREAIDANDVRQTRRDAAQEGELADLRRSIEAGQAVQADVRRMREAREQAEQAELTRDRRHARLVRFMSLVVVPIVTAALAALGAYIANSH